MTFRPILFALALATLAPAGVLAAATESTPAPAVADAACSTTMVCKKALSSYLSPDKKTEWKDAAEGLRYSEVRVGKAKGKSPVGKVDMFLHLRAVDGKGHVLKDTQAAIDSCCGGSKEKKPGAFEMKAPLRIRKGHGEMLPILEQTMEDMKEGGKRVVRIPHAQIDGKNLYYATQLPLEAGEDLYVEVSLLVVRPVR